MNYCVSENTILFVKDIQITEEIETSKGTIKFINCEISRGVQITVDSTIIIRKCVIEDDCYIGSDISDCKYVKRILTIFGNQSKVFKFNYITITGGIRSISSIGDSSKIIIGRSNGLLNINGRDFGIVNYGNVIINNGNFATTINSIGESAIYCGQGSRLSLYNFDALSLNLINKGIVVNDITEIYSDLKEFTISSDLKTEIWFSETYSKWCECKFRGTNIKNFREIKLIQPSRFHFSKVEIRIDPIERNFYYPVKIEEGKIINCSNKSKHIYKDNGTIILKPFASINLEKTVFQGNPKIIVKKSLEIHNSIIKNSTIRFNSPVIVNNSVIINSKIEITRNMEDEVIKDSEL